MTATTFGRDTPLSTDAAVTLTPVVCSIVDIARAGVWPSYGFWLHKSTPTIQLPRLDVY